MFLFFVWSRRNRKLCLAKMGGGNKNGALGERRIC